MLRALVPRRLVSSHRPCSFRTNETHRIHPLRDGVARPSSSPLSSCAGNPRWKTSTLHVIRPLSTFSSCQCTTTCCTSSTQVTIPPSPSYSSSSTYSSSSPDSNSPRVSPETIIQRLSQDPDTFTEALRLFYRIRHEDGHIPHADTFLHVIAACYPREPPPPLKYNEMSLEIPAMWCEYDTATELYDDMQKLIGEEKIGPSEDASLFDEARTALLRLYRLRVSPLTNEALERVVVNRAEALFKERVPVSIDVWLEMVRLYLRYQLFEKACKLSEAMENSRVGLFSSEDREVKETLVEVKRIREAYLPRTKGDSSTTSRLPNV